MKNGTIGVFIALVLVAIVGFGVYYATTEKTAEQNESLDVQVEMPQGETGPADTEQEDMSEATDNAMTSEESTAN